MPIPVIKTSFLSLKPLEPVLVFSSVDEAHIFQSNCRQGRILADQDPHWVFLPLPSGLLRLRKASNGDIAYDFEHHFMARDFNASIKGLGKIYMNTGDRPHFDRTVYVGMMG